MTTPPPDTGTDSKTFAPSTAKMPPMFSMKLNTYEVPMSLHAENRAKLVRELRREAAEAAIAPSSPSPPTRRSSVSVDDVVYLEGGTQLTRNDTDHEPIFRQESYFHYLFGAKEPGCAGAIDVRTGESTLFVPRLPRAYATWLGKIETPEEIKARYGVDEVMYSDEAQEFLKVRVLANRASREETNFDLLADAAAKKDIAAAAAGEEEEKKTSPVIPATGNGVAKILLMSGVNSDSGNSYEPPALPNLAAGATEPPLLCDDLNPLFPILAECRVTKSPSELALLRHVAELTSDAHVQMMRNCRPGMAEFQLESIFRHHVYYNHGCRNLAYTPICGCGPNSAVLHYGHAAAPNDYVFRDGDICLLDVGTEYHCYGSDITSSFPANGKFTDDQRGVYEGVLAAQLAVYDMLKPGVSWVDCHRAAEAKILEALLDLGVITLADGAANDVEELVEKRLGAVFMPHGLGHFIGIDTHDVGGYLPGCPERSTLPGLKSLRTARTMEEDMAVTVEPGCYFIDSVLDDALEDEELSRYIVRGRLADFRGTGGVRLEDVVRVTDCGCDNLTTCPRTVEEVEHVMGGGKWPPTKDAAPELRRTRLAHV